MENLEPIVQCSILQATDDAHAKMDKCTSINTQKQITYVNAIRILPVFSQRDYCFSDKCTEHK